MVHDYLRYIYAGPLNKLVFSKSKIFYQVKFLLLKSKLQAKAGKCSKKIWKIKFDLFHYKIYLGIGIYYFWHRNKIKK